MSPSLSHSFIKISESEWSIMKKTILFPKTSFKRLPILLKTSDSSISWKFVCVADHGYLDRLHGLIKSEITTQTQFVSHSLTIVSCPERHIKQCSDSLFRNGKNVFAWQVYFLDCEYIMEFSAFTRQTICKCVAEDRACCAINKLL